MANYHRGEIDAEFDGKSYRLVLTLGALAELEAAFNAEDMISVATRFESGKISAVDALKVLGAGLRGGGYDIPDAAIARMQTKNGAAGYVDIVARLLSATFGGAQGRTVGADQKEGGRPFPGPT